MMGSLSNGLKRLCWGCEWCVVVREREREREGEERNGGFYVHVQ
jgi:hypothetical protein